MTAFAPVRTSALYRAQRGAGARFVEAAGWRIADVYSSADDEEARARRGVGLSDVSARGKLGVRGETVEALGMKLTGRALPPVGRASRERLDGASVLLCRVAADELTVLTAAADHAAAADLLARAVQGAGCVHLTDLTAALAAADVIGPRLGTLLERLVAVDLSAVPPLGVVHCELGHVRATLVRLDQPAVAAFRILVPRESGDFVWHTLIDTGGDLGLIPIGATAHARLLGPA